MADALTALEQVLSDLETLAASVASCRKIVSPEKVKSNVRTIALTFFEGVRPELDQVQRRAGLCEEIEFTVSAMLTLTGGPREKVAYGGQIAELRPYLQEALIDIMRARGVRDLALSATEREILKTLEGLLPDSALSYQQVLRDIGQGKRVSWRGTGTELREVLREVMDHLAPDSKVMEAPGFQAEDGQTKPTQKQKVRYILKARRAKSAVIAVNEGTLDTIDTSIAALARSTYTRGAVATHTVTDGAEVRKLKHYVDALLIEILEISA